MQPSAAIKNYIKAQETFSAKPYLDPPGNKIGQYSTAWGHLIRPNEKYLLNKVLTRAEGDAIFEKDVAAIAGELNGHISRPMTQDQYDGIFDLSYNAGSGSGAKVLVTWNNTGDSTKVADHIRQYNKAEKDGKKQPNPVLTKRRAYDANLFQNSVSLVNATEIIESLPPVKRNLILITVIGLIALILYYSLTEID